MAYITSQNGSRQPMFLATTGALLTLSLTAVSLRSELLKTQKCIIGGRSASHRLYCRIARIHHVGLDDYFMVVALIVAIGMGVQNEFHVNWGTGYKKIFTIEDLWITTDIK